MSGILAKKIGMTQIFEDGKFIPVTVVEAGPNFVLQKKTVENDGYTALQLGFDEKKEKNQMQVFSVLKIIEQIHEDYPSLTISNEGESDFIIEYIPNPEKPKVVNAIKTVLLCIIIFFGSAFTIMAFNNDISVTDVFDKLYGQVTGTKADGVNELEVCYCIGLGLGIILFFNHVGRKKITPDPTPIQIEMRKYEKDVDTTFIENAGRGGHSIDVS